MKSKEERLAYHYKRLTTIEKEISEAYAALEKTESLERTAEIRTIRRRAKAKLALNFSKKRRTLNLIDNINKQGLG